MNHQKIRAFVETVDWAHFDTIGVFAFNAIFANNERHLDTSLIPARRILGAQGFENWSVIDFKLLFQLIDPIQRLSGSQVVGVDGFKRLQGG